MVIIIIIIQFHIFIWRGARPHVHCLAYLLDSAQNQILYGSTNLIRVNSWISMLITMLFNYYFFLKKSCVKYQKKYFNEKKHI